MGAYSKTLKDIKSGNMDNLSKQAEQQALQRVDLKVLSQNQTQLKQYESQLAQMKDQEAMKGLAKQEVQKQAVTTLQARRKCYSRPWIDVIFSKRNLISNGQP